MPHGYRRRARVGDREALADEVLAVVGASSALFIAMSCLAPSEEDRVTSACVESPADAPNSGGVVQGGHPERQFYRPGEKVPEADLDHVIVDGYVIVRYSPDLPAAQRRRLRRTIDGVQMPVVAVPASRAGNGALVATTTERTLTCSSVDLDGFVSFRDSWFEDRYGSTPE